MGRFGTEILASEENLAALADLNEECVVRACTRTRMNRLVLAMGSFVIPTYGQQEGSARTGHFGRSCYHPLSCFNQYGDLERVWLRDGNVASAHDWRLVLEPMVARYRDRSLPRYFPAHTAFALSELYEYLEREYFFYAIWIPANEVPRRKISPLLTRPIGRPSKKPNVLFVSFGYQARIWTQPRRVIVLHWRRFSCHAFIDNAVRLPLFALVYNLGNLLRRLVLPRSLRHRCLSTVWDKLIKIGAKVVRHGRYVIFQVAEVAVPQEIFQQIPGRSGVLSRSRTPDSRARGDSQRGSPGAIGAVSAETGTPSRRCAAPDDHTTNKIVLETGKGMFGRKRCRRSGPPVARQPLYRPAPPHGHLP